MIAQLPFPPAEHPDAIAFRRWLYEAQTEALKIVKANTHLPRVTLNVVPGLYGAVITATLTGELRRMTLHFDHLRNKGESPIKDTVRNIANVLGLKRGE